MIRSVILALAVCLATSGIPAEEKTGDWVDLFDGKTMDGWKVNENAESWKVADGSLVFRRIPR